MSANEQKSSIVAQFAPHPSSATSISWKAGLTSRNSLGAAASEGPALLDAAVESSAEERVRPLIFDDIDGEKSGLQTVMERLPDWRVCRAAPGVWRSRCQISCPKKAWVLGKCAIANGPSNTGKNKPGNMTLHCCRRHRHGCWLGAAATARVAKAAATASGAKAQAVAGASSGWKVGVFPTFCCWFNLTFGCGKKQ